MYKSSLVNSKVLHSALWRQVLRKGKWEKSLVEVGAGNGAYPCGKNKDINSTEALNTDAATEEMSLEPMD